MLFRRPEMRLIRLLDGLGTFGTLRSLGTLRFLGALGADVGDILLIL